MTGVARKKEREAGVSRHPGRVYGASKGKRPGEKHWYRQVWTFSKWNEFVETRTVGTLAQVCAGGSSLGRVRVDADRAAPGANVVADYRHLPLPDNSFDTVCCDPPYLIDHPNRIHLQRELVRVARRRVLFKAPWIPRASDWALSETVLLGSHTCANVAVLSVLDYGHADQLVLGGHSD